MSVTEEQWYTRPIFSISDAKKSVGYYCTLLGFSQDWKYEEGEKLIVAQVSKGEFELILAGNLDRIGTGRVFVSLDDTEMRTFESVLQESQVEPESIHWGYPAMRIRDPDGNEMIFPQESDA